MGAKVQWDKSEVAAMVRVARSVAEASAAAPPARHRTLLDGLRDLTGAVVAILWFTLEAPTATIAAPPAEGDTPPAVVIGLDDEDTGRRLATRAAGGNGHDPALKRLLGRAEKRPAGTTLTRTRRQLLPDDRRWYASNHVAHVRKPAGIDDGIYSAHVLTPGRAAVVCVCRAWGHPTPFDDSDCHLVDLLHHECAASLYRDHAPLADVDTLPLSPRERQTLRKLLGGRSEKQIAAEMRLSVNTVHHYVKSIYRHFGVSSRAELLARWMDRQA